MDMTGFPDGEPTRVGVAITDYLAGLYASQGILLALTIGTTAVSASTSTSRCSKRCSR
jgi:hypothetical protein